ncbi:MAG: thiol reductant ABC exporter subunit CydD [Aeromicrobium sp.]
MKPIDPRVLPHLAPAKHSLAGVVGASLMSGGLLVAQAFAVAALIAGLFDGASSVAPDRWQDAVTAGTWLAAITVLRALTAWAGDVLSSQAALAVGTTMRRRAVEAALELGPLALSRRRTGDVALLTTRGIAAVEPYLTRYLPTLVVAMTLPPLTVVAIATQDWLSALIVLLTLPLVPVFAILIGLTTQDKADRQWRLLTTLSGHFLDVMRGLPTLVAYRRAEAQSVSIRAITHHYREATKETLKLGFASSAALELIATISVALVAVTVGLRLSGGSLDLRTALVVLLLAPEAYWPLRRVGAEFHSAAEGTATFEEVNRLLDEPATLLAPVPAPCAALGITLDSVRVSYPSRSAVVLDGFSASIPGRGVTAITGPSGGGKSTLLSVLTGDLPMTSGTIAVGGQALTADMVPAWQHQIAWVSQRPWIAAATIAENIRLARPEATDADVWQALERVALGEAVATMPLGLDTVVGEDGVGLSAGQRARLALARVVVADRPLVLLDEPTAHLDAETEQAIADTLTWLGRRSCVVVVAHRPGIVEIADHIIDVPLLPAIPPSPRAAPHTAPSTPSRGDEPTSAPVSAPVSEPTSRPADSARATSRRLVLGMVLGALASASGVALTATAGWLIARAAEHPPVLVLMVAIVAVRTFGLARPALRYAERLVSHDVALALLADRRAAVYDLLVPLTPGRLSRQRGDLLTSVVDDVDSLLDKQLRVRMPLATTVLVGALAAAFATWKLPTAGLIVLTVTVTGATLAWLVARSGVQRAEATYVRQRAALSALIVQTLQGAGDLVMWQAAQRRLDAIDSVGQAAGRAALRSARAVATGRALCTLVAGAGMLAVAWTGSSAVVEGSLSKPTLALLVLLPLALAEVIAPLADAGALSVRTEAADDRLAHLASLTPAVTSPTAPRTTDLSSPTLVVDQVAAGWGDTTAFHDVSFDLAAGARIGVVGPSGCGKSTLAAVLLRFLDPTSGTVSLEGVQLNELALADVRRTVGLVDDDPHIFGSNLRENLRLAGPSATDEELLEALRSAALEPWLAALPQGLDTPLGDGAAQVSGGERARIGLARALLADQPVLVLDEPTAHLDSATAAAVTDDLLATQGRTIVWITHGTVGLDRMDSVLTFEEHLAVARS